MFFDPLPNILSPQHHHRPVLSMNSESDDSKISFFWNFFSSSLWIPAGSALSVKVSVKEKCQLTHWFSFCPIWSCAACRQQKEFPICPA